MGSYYYLKDKNSDFGYIPVPEDEYVQAIIRIAKRAGVEIMDDLILEEIEKMNTVKESSQSTLTVRKKNAKLRILKSPALVR